MIDIHTTIIEISIANPNLLYLSQTWVKGKPRFSHQNRPFVLLLAELEHGHHDCQRLRGQSAIESAQNDHATAVQSMIANKEARLVYFWDETKRIMGHCDLPTVTIPSREVDGALGYSMVSGIHPYLTGMILHDFWWVKTGWCVALA